MDLPPGMAKGLERMHSHAPVPLNADQKTVSLKAIKDMIFALQFLGENISKDKLDESLRIAVLNGCEHNFTTLSEQVGYNGDIRKEMDERTENIRFLNKKVRDLEEQLGKANLTPAFKEQAKYLHEKVKRWWHTKGFSFLNDAAIGEWQFSATFSFSVRDSVWSHDPTPVTSKERVKNLLVEMQKHWHLESDGDRDWMVVCDEHNIQLAQKLFKTAFPSAICLNIEMYSRRCRGGGEKLYLRHAKVMFDVKDIIALPDQPKPED